MTQDNDSDSSRYHIPNLGRALRVMEYLATCPQGATLTEIVDGLECPKNAIFRITTTLFDNGYLRRDENTSKFTLTRKFLGFALSGVTDQDLIGNSIGIMRELRDVTDTSVFLGALYGAEGVILEQAPGGRPFRFSVDLGSRFNLHSGAPGKAMLAFLPEKECEALMKKMDFKKFNERTITDLDEFRVELKKIRECGYALDHAEEFEAVHCIGAPIFDASGSMVAAIWISGQAVVLPTDRFDEYGRIVKEHADRISELLGFTKS